MKIGNTTRRAWLAVGLVAAATLSGCATVQRQAFNAAAAKHIKTVVVAQPENQDQYEAAVIGHPAASFGLIGGLIAAADIQSKSNRLTAAIDAKEVRLQERFAQRMAEQLTAAGYQPTVVIVPKDKKDDEAVRFLKSQAKADVVLMVEVVGGYWAAGPQSDYFPRVLARVKAVEGQSDKLLYQDTISYGYAAPRSETVHLASDPVFRFNTIDVLTADPVKTREGLYQGVNAVVGQVVADLKRE